MNGPLCVFVDSIRLAKKSIFIFCTNEPHHWGLVMRKTLFRVVKPGKIQTGLSEMSVMCRHLPDWQSSKFCQTSRIFDRPFIWKYVLHAVVCQTYGLSQMKKLLDLPKFCLVCLAGPVLNNTYLFS